MTQRSDQTLALAALAAFAAGAPPPIVPRRPEPRAGLPGSATPELRAKRQAERARRREAKHKARTAAAAKRGQR